MKRRILATAIAAITAATCAAGLAACGGDGDDGGYKPTALEKAHENYYKTQNMTITVTDNRTVKNGNDYTTLVEVDYAHKAAHINRVYGTSELEGVACIIHGEIYVELDSDAHGFYLYNNYKHVNNNNETVYDEGWSKLERSDLYEGVTEFNDQTEFEVHLLCNWADIYIPTLLYSYGASWSETESGGLTILPSLLKTFTKSTNGFTASLYFCIEDGNGGYDRYACTVTYKLDGQTRLESTVMDFGTNGNVTVEYTYGTATVTIPDEAKNASPIH